MANRIVNHKKNVISESKVSKGKINSGMLVKFNYYSNSYDKTPMVLCTERDNKNRLISGFNLNYLSEYEVQSILKEKSFVSMTNYNIYKHAFRSYKLNKITMLKEVVYDVDTERGKHSIEKDTNLGSEESKKERKKEKRKVIKK